MSGSYDGSSHQQCINIYIYSTFLDCIFYDSLSLGLGGGGEEASLKVALPGLESTETHTADLGPPSLALA